MILRTGSTPLSRPANPAKLFEHFVDFVKRVPIPPPKKHQPSVPLAWLYDKALDSSKGGQAPLPKSRPRRRSKPALGTQPPPFDGLDAAQALRQQSALSLRPYLDALHRTPRSGGRSHVNESDIYTLNCLLEKELESYSVPESSPSLFREIVEFGLNLCQENVSSSVLRVTMRVTNVALIAFAQNDTPEVQLLKRLRTHLVEVLSRQLDSSLSIETLWLAIALAPHCSRATPMPETELMQFALQITSRTHLCAKDEELSTLARCLFVVLERPPFVAGFAESVRDVLRKALSLSIENSFFLTVGWIAKALVQVSELLCHRVRWWARHSKQIFCNCCLRRSNTN